MRAQLARTEMERAMLKKRCPSPKCFKRIFATDGLMKRFVFIILHADCWPVRQLLPNSLSGTMRGANAFLLRRLSQRLRLGNWRLSVCLAAALDARASGGHAPNYGVKAG